MFVFFPLFCFVGRLLYVSRLLRRLLLVQGTILSHHRRGIEHRGLTQVRESGAVLAGVSAAQGAGGGHLDRLAGFKSTRGFLESGEKSLDGFGGEIFVVVVVDLDHGGIDTGTQAFDLDESEQTILSGVAGSDAQVLGDRLDDLGAAATAELARCLDGRQSIQERKKTMQILSYRRAELNKVLAHRLTVVHGVESRDFVDTHRGHLEHAGDLVHDANAGVTVLALAQIQDRHDGSLLVLGGIALEDLIDEFKVLLGELERDGRVVGGRVAMLNGNN